jgi:glycosyltransferase involved in cell wall biosynthesis
MVLGLVWNTAKMRKRRVKRKFEHHFSGSYYLAQFPENERASISDPLEHFLLYWDINNKDPNPFFSMGDYLKANPDVALSGQNPLVHFIERGIIEKRPLAPSSIGSLNGPHQDAREWTMEKVSISTEVDSLSLLSSYLHNIGVSFDSEPNVVDEKYYRSCLVGEEVANCTEHFEEIGWKSGLNPTPWFNTRFYLETYDDVAQAGVNPFLHFVEQGYREFRIPNHQNYRNFKSVLLGRSIELEAQNWHASGYQFKSVEFESIKRLILSKKMKKGPLVISVGHSKYLNDVGGVQLYTFVEAQKFNELNFNYLHLAPSRVLPTLADSSLADMCVNLTYNNEEISGDFMLSDLADLVVEINPDLPNIAVIINSLYGWHPGLLEMVLDQIAAENHYWMFHDYSAFCSNSNLNFENLISCKNPKLEAGICTTCRYGKNRSSHVQRITQFFESRNWSVATPSKSTTENVSNYLKINPDRVLTIPHGGLSAKKGLRTFAGRPRIAFVGQPVVHKGWLTYLNFVDMGLKDFDFFHFGSHPSEVSGVKYFPLRNRFADLNTARDMLIHHQIDAVFICPTWEETFCFVAYEALAAGCKVIYSKGSGNVYDLCEGNSIYFDPEDTQLVKNINEAVMNGRKMERSISEFEFSGTIASEFTV